MPRVLSVLALLLFAVPPAYVVIHSYRQYTTALQLQEALTLIENMKVPVTRYFRSHGACPGDNSLTSIGDIPVAASLGGNRVSMLQTQTSPCAIIATMRRDGVASPIAGARVYALALPGQKAGSGTLQWSCYAPDIAPDFRPKTCLGTLPPRIAR